MIQADPSLLTLGAVARRFGCPAWQIRRLFERGLLPPAPRIGAYRVVAVRDLPLIEHALRAAGYLPRAGQPSPLSTSSPSSTKGDQPVADIKERCP